MKKIFLILCLLLFSITATARDSYNDSFSDFVSESDFDQKVSGIMALRGHMKHVDEDFAKRLVNEAKEVVSKNGSWMPVHVLIGQAINESDLRWWLMRGLDCGITQNRVNLFQKRRKKMKRLCKALSKSSKMSFRYAMKEHSRYRKRYCKKYKDGTLGQMKCLLNTYYQGPKWLRYRRRTCKLVKDEWLSQKGYEKKVRRCRVKNRYWLRVMCFATGVKLGRPPISRRGNIMSCRRAKSIKWIRRVYSNKRYQRHRKKVARLVSKRYK